MASTAYDLERFVQAQASVYSAVVRELGEGRKTSHWMWFVFPQVAGLGHSFMSERYAISSLDEARAYLAHPVLGPRLRECTRLVLEGGAVETGADATSGSRGRTAEEIFGPIDAMKLRSSMTLFHRVAPNEPAFLEVLNRFFGGQPDGATDRRL